MLEDTTRNHENSDEMEEEDEDDIIIDDEFSPFVSIKKVLVFGTDELVLNNMSRQLARAKYYVVVAQKVTELRNTINRMDPHLIVLQANGNLDRNIVKIVSNISGQIEGRSQRYGKNLRKVKLILYRVAERIDKKTIMEEDISETKKALDQCSQFMKFEYIGLFNSIVFMRKVKEILGESKEDES